MIQQVCILAKVLRKLGDAASSNFLIISSKFASHVFSQSIMHMDVVKAFHEKKPHLVQRNQIDEKLNKNSKITHF